MNVSIFEENYFTASLRKLLSYAEDTWWHELTSPILNIENTSYLESQTNRWQTGLAAEYMLKPDLNALLHSL
jgi:hypothetical protein